MKNRDIEVAPNTLVDLSLCTTEALDGLPSGLRVKGDLYLGGCENLKTLPSRLVVGGGLYLGWCKNLNDLPLDLQVAENIWYNDKTGFARDPEKLQELQLRLPGKLKKLT